MGVTVEGMRGLLALLVVAVLFAAPAHADPGDYLNMLGKYGFNITDKTGPALVKAGQTVCVDLRGGASVEAESAAVFRIMPEGWTQKKVGNLVSAAQMTLCPDTL